MRSHLNLTVNGQLKRDFMAHYRGSLSRFVEEKMAEYVELMGLQWWMPCWSCKRRPHIRVVMNNGGKCPMPGCGAVLLEKDEKKTTIAVQNMSSAPATPLAVAEKTENKAEVAPKVLHGG